MKMINEIRSPHPTQSKYEKFIYTPSPNGRGRIDRDNLFRHIWVRALLTILLIIGILFTPNQSQAYLSELNLVPFRVESGSRPLAMGGAFVGLSNDVNAAFFNPGGLPWAKGICLNVKDINNFSASQAYPTGYGSTLGISVLQAGLFDLPVSAGKNADFSSAILLLSAGTKLSALPPLSDNKIADNIGFGINFKTLLALSLRKTGEPDRTAKGLNMDAGLLYKINRFSAMGINASNILSGAKLSWDNGLTEEAPMVLRIGGSSKIIGDIWSPIYLEDQEFTLSYDVETMNSQSSSMYFGSEWAYAGTYFLRLGCYVCPQRTSTSIGLGVRIEDWGVDATSYANPIKGSGDFYLSILYFPEEWVFVKRPAQKYPPIRIADPVINLSPEDNLITYEDRILVSGTAKPGVEVYVSDQRADIDSNQNFAVLLPLSIGKNLIVIDSYLEGGRLSQEKKIFRKAKVVVAEEKLVEQELKEAKTPEQKSKLEEEKKNLLFNKERLETLVTMGVVEVSPEAEFSIEAPVTRGELSSWLVKAANYPLPRVNADPFKDVPKEHPLAPYIKVAVERGLIKPFPDSTFRPNATISQSEGEEIFRRFGVIK